MSLDSPVREKFDHTSDRASDRAAGDNYGKSGDAQLVELMKATQCAKKLDSSFKYSLRIRALINLSAAAVLWTIIYFFIRYIFLS